MVRLWYFVFGNGVLAGAIYAGVDVSRLLLWLLVVFLFCFGSWLLWTVARPEAPIIKAEHLLIYAHPIIWGGTALFCRYVYGLAWREVFTGLAIVAVMVGIPVVLVRLMLSTRPALRTIDAPYWRVVEDGPRRLNPP